MQVKHIKNPLEKSDIELIEVDYKYQNVEGLFNELNLGDKTDYIAVVSGGKVEWDHIYSKDDEIIFIVDLQGKNAGIIGGIVLIIVGVVISGMSWGAAAPVGGFLIKCGIGLLIGGIIGLAMSSGLGKTQEVDEVSQTYTWNGIQNIIGEGATMPVVVGEHRMGGAVIEAFLTGGGQTKYNKIWVSDNGTPSYTYIREGKGDQDDKEVFKDMSYDDVYKYEAYVVNVGATGIQESKYLNVLLALSEGEIESVDMSKAYINNKEISLYGDITQDYRLGRNTQPPLTGFNKIARHYSLSGVQLKYNTPYVYKTNNVSDQAIVTLTFPSLFQTNDEGDIKELAAIFKIEYANYIPDVENAIYTSAGDFCVAAASKSKMDYDIIINLPELDNYLIRVTRTTGEHEDISKSSVSYFASVSEIEFANLTYPNTALLGLQIKATDKLSGAMPNISTMIKGVKFQDVRDLQGKVQWTDNPANILYGMLTNKRYGLGRWITDDKIDIESLQEYADWCDEVVTYKYYDSSVGKYIDKTEKRYAFNGVFDTGLKAYELIDSICMSSRAIPYWSGDKLKITIERPTEPSQLFSMGNIIEDSFEEAYYGMQDVPNQINVTFVNEDDDYKQQSMVCVDAFRSDEVTYSKTIDVKGLTTVSRVKREAVFAMKKAKAMRASIKFSAGMDAVILEAGDVFLFQHQTPEYGITGGRIKKVNQNSIVMDQAADVTQGIEYQILIRKRDNTIIEHNLIAEETESTDEIKITSLPNCAVGDVYSFGIINKEAKPYKVTSITKKTESTVEITGEEYNESIFDDDENIFVEDIQYSSLGLTETFELDGSAEDPIPIKIADNPASTVSYYDQPPYVTDIILTEQVEIANKQVISNIVVDFAGVRMPENSLAKISHYDILHSTDGNQWEARRAVGLRHTVRNVEIGVKHYFLIKPYTNYMITNDIENDIIYYLKWDITPEGKAPIPDQIEGLFGVQNNNTILLQWSPVENTSVDYYEIREGAWDYGQRLGVTKNTNFTTAVKRKGIMKYYVKAKSVSGDFAILPAETSIDTALGNTQNIIYELDEVDNGWQGVSHDFKIADDGTLQLLPGIKKGEYISEMVDLEAFVRSRTLVDFAIQAIYSSNVRWMDVNEDWISAFSQGAWGTQADIDDIEHTHEIATELQSSPEHIDILRLNSDLATENGVNPIISENVIYSPGVYHKGVSKQFDTKLDYSMSLTDDYSVMGRYTLGTNFTSGVIWQFSDGSNTLQILAFADGRFWLWDFKTHIEVVLDPLAAGNNFLFGIGTTLNPNEIKFYVANTTQGIYGSNTGFLSITKPNKIIL